LTTYGGTPRQNPASPAVRVARDYARHPAVWRFLLPRQVSGPVVLASLDEVMTRNLLQSYPAALVLGQSLADLDGVAHAAVWDGHRSPLRPGTVALVICDDRDGTCAKALMPTVAAGGECVAIVRSTEPYRFALFPTPEQLRAVIGTGWPLTYDGSPRRWLGYWLATTRIWAHLSRSGLALRWPNDSIVDAVLKHVGVILGGRAYLCGLIAGRGLGQLTLRVRCEGRELAVRVAVTPDSARRLRNHQRVLADLSTRLGSAWNSVAFPDVVAAGNADGISWAAERWVRLPVIRASRSWRPSGHGWDALRAIASELATVAETGRTDADWPLGWATGLDAVAPGLVEEIMDALAPIGAANMTTAWCHGDLWPGNVFLRKPPLPPVVIDWERARPDAPAGLDAVYAELCRVVMHRKCTFGDAAIWVAQSGSAGLATVEVGGKPFASWDRSEQQALLLATVIHYATGENEGAPADRWTEGWGAMNIVPLMKALRRLRSRLGCQIAGPSRTRAVGTAVGSSDRPVAAAVPFPAIVVAHRDGRSPPPLRPGRAG
jgi:Phosphotransferase enzyme family